MCIGIVDLFKVLIEKNKIGEVFLDVQICFVVQCKNGDDDQDQMGEIQKNVQCSVCGEFFMCVFVGGCIFNQMVYNENKSCQIEYSYNCLDFVQKFGEGEQKYWYSGG